MLLTKVDLPDPDTPVTAVIIPKGKSTVKFCKLFSDAPVIFTVLSASTGLRLVGTGIFFLPDRY